MTEQTELRLVLAVTFAMLIFGQIVFWPQTPTTTVAPVGCWPDVTIEDEPVVLR